MYFTQLPTVPLIKIEVKTENTKEVRGRRKSRSILIYPRFSFLKDIKSNRSQSSPDYHRYPLYPLIQDDNRYPLLLRSPSFYKTYPFLVTSRGSKLGLVNNWKCSVKTRTTLSQRRRPFTFQTRSVRNKGDLNP